MTARETLYDSIHQIREVERQMTQRVMLSGYFNEEEVKRDTLNIQQYVIKDSLKPFRNVKAYLYIKGVFYIQLLEATNIADINAYLKDYHARLVKRPSLFNTVRIVHQSYQNPTPYLQAFDCENNPQAGPILIETEKTEEQIQDRSFQIYDLFMEGAKKKSENPSHKVGTMVVLSNDDMSILISSRFMSLQEYIDFYIGEINVDRDQEFNYPLPPTFFEVMEFMELEDYESFRAK